MMDIDGTNQHLLVTSQDGEPCVNSTVWSPDGKCVATIEGYIGCVTETYDPFSPGHGRWEPLPGAPGGVYVIPSDGESITLPGDASLGVVPIAESVDGNLAVPVRPGFAPRMKWLSSIPIAPEEKGNLSNEALVGHLYFDDDGVDNSSALHVISLQDSTDQILYDLTSSYLDNINDLIYVSRDAQFVSHFCNGSFGSCRGGSDNAAINIKDKNGQHLSAFPVEGNSYEMSITGPVRFSPVDTNQVLVPYVDYNEDGDTFADAFVAVIDWSSGEFLRTFNGREYTTADWTPEGDILLVGKDGNVYLATKSSRTFSDPVEYITSKDTIRNLVVSPDGSRIAYTMNGHIWSSDFDGSNFRRLTGFTEGFNMFPEWSPNSDYIAFKHLNADRGPNDHGQLWIVAADSGNVRIRETTNTPNAIPVQANGEWIGVNGSFAWR
jgi:hypothetical protein